MYSAPLVAERERDDDGRGSAGIECRSRREPVGVASGPRRKKCICIWSTRETASALDNYETRWASREPLNMPVWGVQVAEKPAGEAAIRHVVCAEFFFFFSFFFLSFFIPGDEAGELLHRGRAGDQVDCICWWSVVQLGRAR